MYLKIIIHWLHFAGIRNTVHGSQIRLEQARAYAGDTKPYRDELVELSRRME